MDKLLRIEAVSEMLGIPVDTLRNWRAHGRGPQPAKLGRRLVWRESQINAWLDEQFALAEKK